MPASLEFFKRYANPVFVETGTYLCEGIELALGAGFGEVRSVELSEKLFGKAQTKYAGRSNIKLYHGTSETRLWDMIADIRTPITFWLDAHFSGGITVKGPEMSPVMKELAIIGRHPVKNHVIMIDDRRQVGTADFDFVTEAQIREAILAINPAYKIFYDTGSRAQAMFVDDIIVAQAA